MAITGSIGKAVVEVVGDASNLGTSIHSEVSGAVAKVEAQSSSSFDRLANVGKKAFIGLTVAATTFGGAAVAEALKGEQAHARLAVAIKNAGGSFDQYKGQIEDTSNKMAKLGFNNVETESALARLTQIVHSPTEALKDLGLATDIAAATGRDLNSSALLVGKVAEGNTQVLKRLGLATKDAGGQTITAAQGMQELAKAFGGTAQAQAETFAGKIKALRAEAANLTEQAGNFLIPIIEKLISVTIQGVDWFERHKVIAEALAFVIGGALTLAMGAYVLQEGKAFALATANRIESIAGLVTSLGSVFVGTTVAATAAATSQEAFNGATALGFPLVEAETGALLEESVAADAAAVSTGAAATALSFITGAAIIGGVVALGTALVHFLGGGATVSKEEIKKLSGEIIDFNHHQIDMTALLFQSGTHLKTIEAEAHAAAEAFKKFGTEGLGAGGFAFSNLERDLDPIDKTLASLAKTNAPAAAASFKQFQTELESQGLTAKEVNKIFDNYTGTVKDNALALKLNKDAHKDDGTQLDEFGNKLTDEAKAWDTLTKHVQAYNKSLDPTLNAQLDVIDAQAAYNQDLSGVTDAVNKYGKNSDQANQAVAQAAKDAENLTGKLRAAKDIQDSDASSAINLASQFDRLHKVVGDTNTDFNSLNTIAQQTPIAMTIVGGAIKGATADTAPFQVVIKGLDGSLGGIVGNATKLAIDSMPKLGKAMSDANPIASAINSVFADMAANTGTIVANVAQSIGPLSQYSSILSGIVSATKGAINLPGQSGKDARVLGGGGWIDTGEWAVVGDRGPEIAHNIGGRTQVLSNADSQTYLGAGTPVSVTVPITVQGNATAGTVEQIRRVARNEFAATISDVLGRTKAKVGSR